MKFARLALTIIPTLFMLGCTSPSGELRKNLRAYGMNSNEAKCVSRELTDDLHRSEIKSINRILDAGRRDGTARPSQILVAVESLDDPKILRSVTVANAGCLLLN